VRPRDDMFASTRRSQWIIGQAVDLLYLSNMFNVVVVVVVARRQRQHTTSTVRRRHVSYWSSADWLQSTAARSGHLLSHVRYVHCTVHCSHCSLPAIFARPCKSFTVLRRVRNCQRYYYYYYYAYLRPGLRDHVITLLIAARHLLGC